MISHCWKWSTSHYQSHSELDKAFALKDLGQVNFLGIQVSLLPNGAFHLSQRKYFTAFLSRPKMQYAKGISTPMTSGQRLTAYGSDPVKDVQVYSSIVGACSTPLLLDQKLHIVLILYANSYNSLEAHGRAVRRILRYLAGTFDSGLIMQQNLSSSMALEGFCDADWA